jgi:hypothetical protein
MSRGQFMSNNKEDEVFNFKTNSSGFINPGITISGLKRVHWDWGDGSSYQAASFGSHTYSSGGTKNCRFIGDNFSVISSLFFNSDSIIDDVLIDSRFTNINNINFSQNIGLTGITVGYIPTPLTIDVRFCNIIGDLDLTNVTLTGLNNRFNNNSNLTSITHTTSTENIGLYQVNNCNLTGNHDMSMLTGLGGQFYINNNTSLTGITHTASTEVFNIYESYNCDLTGNHDVSMFPGLGGVFQTHSNSALTGITHTASTQTFSNYRVQGCNLTGNHDMSMLPGLGGVFYINNNTSLTGITHTASTETFSQYLAFDCNLTGNHDMSMLPGLGGNILIYSNPLLTGIIHTASTEVFFTYNAATCNLDYVNFLPLSGASISTIDLEDNSMSVTDVNHILVDFDNISTNLNPSGWTGTTLNISGTNAAPDSSSGGFDGIAALSSLTG